MPRKKQKVYHNENTCKLCSSDSDDEVIYGKKVKIESGTVHEFCVLFACGLTQNGEDDEGVFGFLAEDIRKEILRANKLRCTFCKQNTVASACAVQACRVKYHFNCGLKNDCLFHFFDCFPSYCVKHRPPLDKLYSTVDPELTCNICFDRLQSNDSETSTSQLRYQILLTSCCQKFLHISCVKAQAYNAGIHHIKCPLCNDRDSFINCAQEHGVYIPDRDATWEDPSVWREQESRYSKCDAETCRCKHGRNHNEENSDWEINVCTTCGSFGIHTACSSELTMNEPEEFDYECPDCKKLMKMKSEPAIPISEPAIRLNEPVIATCEPPSNPPSNLSSTHSQSKEEIEVIELSSDEDDDQLICVDLDVCNQFADSSLGGQNGRPMGNGFAKMTH